MKMADKKCIVCGKTHNEVPVFTVTYKEKEFYICPQHIPILIHEPQKLAGIVEDAENFQAG